MKRTAIMLVMFGTVVAGSLDARADSGNPFGFATNKHPLEYEYCKKEPGLYRGHGYKCSSAPRPHPDLEEYALQFVEDVGLCFIAASRPPDYWYTLGEQPERYKYPRIDHYRSPHIRTQIRSFLDEIGVERHSENAYQLVRILEAYISRNPSYRQRFYSGVTTLPGPILPRDTDTTLLKDVFDEMKKKWFVAGQSNVLIEWESSLKRIIEKDIRSDSRNKFEMFNRQIAKKYGPSTTPDRLQDGYKDWSTGLNIIAKIRIEIRKSYHKGYSWVPKEGFDGPGDIEAIKLILTPSDKDKVTNKVEVYFWLVTNDACQKKIEDKADRAF